MTTDHRSEPDATRLAMNRRRFVECLTSVGLGASLLPGTLLAVAQDAERVTVEMLASAATIAGLSFADGELAGVAERLNGERSMLASYATLREQDLGNSVPPAIVFNPVPAGMTLPTESHPPRLSAVEVPRPRTDEDLAFLSVRELAQLIERRDVSSTDLTRLYLTRLRAFDASLHCVVTLTDELALAQARRADAEIAAGRYRGPLHGIPWGAKDLLAVRGYPTTWGASPYRDQVIDQDATVFSRLTEAGAVLVAKLSMGALAQGDRWFGGRTRNPWNLEQGSSGSSAGPGAATAAGLVGFSIGTETRGSIISPSSRCGVTGLRPTFGRVSRHGAMALSWTMDKIGPMCRSAEDCALVLHAINGPDDHDNSLLDVPFNWDANADPAQLRVGYLRSTVEGEIAEDPDDPEVAARAREERARNVEALEVIRAIGIDPQPIELPELPTASLGFILTTEAAAAFDDLTRSNRTASMLGEPESSRWPDAFRLHRFVPAVEYLQANRARSRLIAAMQDVFADLDLIVGSDLGLTNLTGHPEICLPHGFRAADGTPTSLRLTGGLFGEAALVRLAHAFQQRTDHHVQRPPLTV